jgi:hypothetical protein
MTAMLLGEYMGVAAVPTLNQILRFEFGERYAVVSMIGKTVDIPDLEDIIDIMVTEFEWSGGRLATMEFSGTKIQFRRYSNNPNAKPEPPMLIVQPNSTRLGKPIREIAEQVRQAVIMYNLTGEWTTFAKDNL